MKPMRRIALLALACWGCSVQPTAPPVPAQRAQPGYGVVERVTPVRMAERSAAAGGSAARGEARVVYRIAVRMPDGSVQYRDLDRPEFRPGDRVLLTNAGDVLPD
jgi:hypothetical protein